MKHELEELDATACAALIRRGEISPLEMVDAAIARIEERNPALNAIVTPMFEIARERARGPLPDGPFRGVPYLLKDLMGTWAGVRETSGSALLRDFVAPFDSELVTRLKAAGFIVLGKTNTPEFGIVPTTESACFGAARNPWNRGHSTGGSSGGSACAVAARMVPAAHANDGGGSIRIPAACCGLFGLKPTRGRNPLGPIFGDVMNGLVVEHAVTRSVRDSAAILDATCGADAGAPYFAPAPARPFLQEVGAPTGRLRIGVTIDSPLGGATHADCAAAVRATARLLTDQGHHVEEIRAQLDPAALQDAFIKIYACGIAQNVAMASLAVGRQPEANDLEPLTAALAEMGRGISGADYLMAVLTLQLATRQLVAAMDGFDLWLTPTLTEPPVPLGTLDSPADDPLRGLMRASTYVPFTALCNFTGQPAMSFPLHWNEASLPIGVHFVARQGAEALLFRLAAQLEEARGPLRAPAQLSGAAAG